MSEKQSLHLGNVQKTLFLPLYGRAVETQKPHPQLRDPMAVTILGQVDYDFSTMARNVDELSMVAWIRRAQICDKVVCAFAQWFPSGTVVNLGCGLDTTFDRTDNGSLRWYDLDLPDVIALRRKFIPEGERRTYIASSFLEPAWLEQIMVQGNVLFLAAGVFYYFEEPEIKGFFLRLLERFPGCEVLCDVSSPLGIRVANKKVIESSGLDEKSYLKWGLKDKRDILAWDERIRLLRTYRFFANPFGLNLRTILLGAFSDLMGIQYMLQFRLGEKV